MILSLALITVAAFAKALMDLSSEKRLKFQPVNYWLKDPSSANKWKVDSEGVPLIPRQERFLGSSTILSFLTDGWHLMQMIFLTCMFVLIVTYTVQYSVLIDFFIARAVFGLLFEYAFYRPLKGKL